MKLQWKVNISSLFDEVLENPTTRILRIPLQITHNLLRQVAQRASELNDPQLNALMCRLALYEIADPYSKEYDKKLVEEIINKADELAKATGGAE